MKLTGYNLVGYKSIERLWGSECRFTVARPDGSHINEVIDISDMKIQEDDLAGLIQARLLILDVPAMPELSIIEVVK